LDFLASCLLVRVAPGWFADVAAVMEAGVL
jgi:hypothetical protein